MRIDKCSFCACNVYPGHGQMFVRNDCKVFRFCRSKCKKNFALKRNPMKVRWTKTFRRAANKELTLDSTMEFEKRRNVPVRYNRELTAATVQAMKRIADIKKKRADAFWKKRMEVRAEVETRDSLMELKRNIDMIDDKPLREHARNALAVGETKQVHGSANKQSSKKKVSVKAD
eukprot:PhM_4_TR5004/c0_g1_i1/m.16249/K02896/RP-L24e, RPL24; large subunit ribosomal protein L24e